jgi:type VI secretion system protein VasJ
MLDPIQPDQPAGVDVSFDPDFEVLEAEIRKMDSPSGEAVDWAGAAGRAEKILTDKSKDFRVAAALTLCRLHRDGYEGLARGLTDLADLIEQYWDTGYPPVKKSRARANAFSWLVDKLGPAVDRLSVERPESAAAAAGALDRLGGLWSERLGGRAPNVTPLSTRLSERAEAEPAPEPEAPPEPPPAEEPAPRPKPSAPQNEPRSRRPASQMTAAAGPRRSADLLSDLRVAAYRLQDQNRADPAGYRLLRYAVWGTIDDPPPAEKQRTRLPGPPEDLVERLEGFLNRGDAELLQSEAEARLPEYLFWLDLNRYTIAALSGLGPAHRRAADAVLAETRNLTVRLPGLLDLAFENGRPLADPRTKALLAPAQTQSPELETKPDPAGDDRTSAEIEAARTLAARGDPAAALGRLAALIGDLKSGRDRFRARFELAKLTSTDRPELARAHFQTLWDEIDRRDLDTWNPEAARAVYEASLAAAEPETEYRRLALARLARLDPAAILKTGAP